MSLQGSKSAQTADSTSLGCRIRTRLPHFHHLLDSSVPVGGKGSGALVWHCCPANVSGSPATLPATGFPPQASSIVLLLWSRKYACWILRGAGVDSNYGNTRRGKSTLESTIGVHPNTPTLISARNQACAIFISCTQICRAWKMWTRSHSPNQELLGHVELLL